MFPTVIQRNPYVDDEETLSEEEIFGMYKKKRGLKKSFTEDSYRMIGVRHRP